jgi:uncharacterized protein YaaN involved in tellurite resistance
MSQTTRAAATATLAEVEQVTALVLPEPGGEIVALDAAPAPMADAIRSRMAELDIRSTQSIIGFGSKAQAELQVISQEMLVDVKNKDVGPGGRRAGADRVHHPGLFGVGAGCAAQGQLVGALVGPCRAVCQVRGAV